MSKLTCFLLLEKIFGRIDSDHNDYLTAKQNSKFASTGIQANFETFEINSFGKSAKVDNAHLDIIK
ncbi:hypothetical protein DKP84_09675 [Acinetobacter pittii]|nr:hypothetical protein DKP84_09675 [Acinetobacter pittii]